MIYKDEYQNPEVYDAEYGHYTDDFNIFLGIKNKGYALDLACGTGRLTIALAQSGLNCTGLDASTIMLTYAGTKSQGLGIQYAEGDIRQFQFAQLFDLITLAGNSFQALLTKEDQIKMFSCVKHHLHKEGLFIFNTRNPLQEQLISNDDFEFWHDFTDQNGTKVQVFGKQLYDPTKNIMLYTTKRIWPTHETHSEVYLKFTTAEKLIILLEENGFEIIHLYGNIDKGPFSKQSPAIFFLCRLRR